MKKLLLNLLLFGAALCNAQLPRPDHIVVVMFQNKGYTRIVGSDSASYINSLLNDTNAATLSQYYALTHPSQPNYLMLYSGSSQGVTTDDIPANTPFTTCNLGAVLISGGFTFIGYSESMPSAGYLGANTSLYYRKHNPWSDWQGTQANGIPPSVNQPFSSFPSDYNVLPNVSFVVPNIINCMHNGTIQQGDDWLRNNIGPYIAWARTHNSLLIVTFDEDDNSQNNHILTFFYGPMVKHGTYDRFLNHYNLLRTLEDIYGVRTCGGSATTFPVDFLWKRDVPVSGIKENEASSHRLTLSPVPCREQLNISISSPAPNDRVTISLLDVSGRMAKEKKVSLGAGQNNFALGMEDVSTGIYFLNVSGKEISLNRKIIVE
jgi:acid phosphatase